jgi:hypothetical protein
LSSRSVLAAADGWVLMDVDGTRPPPG